MSYTEEYYERANKRLDETIERLEALIESDSLRVQLVEAEAECKRLVKQLATANKWAAKDQRRLDWIAHNWAYCVEKWAKMVPPHDLRVLADNKLAEHDTKIERDAAGEAIMDKARRDAVGKGGVAAIIGKWPGDETDEEIARMLDDKPESEAKDA